MKKVISALMTLVMVMSLVVFASAETRSVRGVGAVNVVDANGNPVEVSTVALSTEQQTAVDTLLNDPAQLETLMGDAYSEDSIFSACDVVVPEGTAFPVTISFSIPQAANADLTGVLHLGNTWEKVPATQSGSTVTATFQSLSPVVFALQPTTGSGNGNGVSPQTNDLPMEAALLGMMLLSAAGAVYVTRRRAA